jgi:hypothetical protein
MLNTNFLLFIPYIVADENTQHSTQQNAFLLFSDILCYKICKPIQHVSSPHGINIRYSYKSKVAQTELTTYVHVKKIENV